MMTDRGGGPSLHLGRDPSHEVRHGMFHYGNKLVLRNLEFGAGGIAQWQSPCLVCTRPWLPPLKCMWEELLNLEPF
jgi:hypothetical protein